MKHLFTRQNLKGALGCAVIFLVVLGVEQWLKSDREYKQPEWALNTKAIKPAGENKHVLVARIDFVKRYRNHDEQYEYYLFSDQGAIRIDDMFRVLAKRARLEAYAHEGEVCHLELVKGVIEPWLVKRVSHCEAVGD